MTIMRKLVTGIATLSAVQIINAHTWVEMVRRISSTGAYVGVGGYPIGHANRTDDGFKDENVLIKILSTDNNPAACGTFTGYDNPEYPPLTAAPGEFIALQYSENGHVSWPNGQDENQVRGYRSGNVMIYGTTETVSNIGINDVLYQWNVAGTGGNQKGRLLAGHFFDDGQCYESSNQDSKPSQIRDERHNKYGLDSLMCQSTVQLPVDATGAYTLLWVWDWPQLANEVGQTTEIYVSCMTVNLDASSDNVPTTAAAFSFDETNVANAAIPSQIQNLIEVEQRGTGASQPPAPTGPADARYQGDSPVFRPGHVV